MLQIKSLIRRNEFDKTQPKRILIENTSRTNFTISTANSNTKQASLVAAADVAKGHSQYHSRYIHHTERILHFYMCL